MALSEGDHMQAECMTLYDLTDGNYSLCHFIIVSVFHLIVELRAHSRVEEQLILNQ